MSIATARLWLKRLADWVKRSSQLRSSVVTTVPVRSAVFTLSSSPPVTCDRRLEQRHLHLGDRRQRNFDRQNVVEHVVVAQISVGEHIIADALGGAQAAAMADHQPALRARSTARWSQIVFAFDGPTPMFTKRDADAAVGDQMIGRHLVPPPRARCDLCFRVLQMLAAVIARRAPTGPCTGLFRAATRRSRSGRTRRRSGGSW